MVVTGESGNGKTTLAIDIVKALQKLQRVESSRLAKISGKKLNTRDIYETLGKLKGGALIIEKAGGLSDASMMALSLAMEGDTGGLLIILEDQKAEIQRLFHKNSNLASKFEYKVDIPVFTNDELLHLQDLMQESWDSLMMNLPCWHFMTGLEMVRRTITGYQWQR